MHINYSVESLKYRHMFRPDDDTDSDSDDFDLIVDGDTIGLEYDDEEDIN